MIDKLHTFSFPGLWIGHAEREKSSAAQNRPWHLGRKRTILDPWFVPARRDKVLPLTAVNKLMRCSTDVLAGPAAPLVARAERICAGASGPAVRVAVIVFLRPGQPDISGDKRDLLWRAFQTPVYQEYRSLEGRLLAWECEAQCGFHLAGPAWSTAIPGTLVNQPCPCGLETPRLVYQHDTIAVPARSFATSA